MKMYIPEIGDRIVLTSDWTFMLIDEYRNRTFCEAVSDLMSGELTSEQKARLDEFESAYNAEIGNEAEYRTKMHNARVAFEAEYEQNKLDWKNFNAKYGRLPQYRSHNMPDRPKYMHYYGFTTRKEYQQNNRNLEKLYELKRKIEAMKDPNRITLPSGTVLQVDRIYIRKGAGMSEFSSVTFLIRSSPEDRFVSKKKKKGFVEGSYRFWAKLQDVNEMEFAHANQTN